MVKIKKNELIERWTQVIDYNFNLSLRGVNWKDKNTPNVKLKLAPFGLTDEKKIDLRFLKLREGLKYQYFKEVDFSYFEFVQRTPEEVRARTGYIGDNKGGYGIQESLFENCLFFQANIPNISGNFIECDFREAKFIGKRISGNFIKCCFDKAIFDNIIWGNVKFEDCSFSRAKFKQCLLANSKWVNCSLKDTKFHHGLLSKNDFSLSEFINSPLTENQIKNIDSNIKIT